MKDEEEEEEEEEGGGEEGGKVVWRKERTFASEARWRRKKEDQRC